MPSTELRPLATRAPLHVVQGGSTSPDAHAFVFLHGYGASSFMWRHWVDTFAARGRVLLVDMKGFGDAPKPDDGRYSPYDLAEAVTEFIQEHDLPSLTLVGQSLGGGVALLTALHMHDEAQKSSRPSRLKRMVLLAPAAYRQRPPPFVWLSHHPRLATTLVRLVGARRVLRWTMRSVVYDRSSVKAEDIDEYARSWRTRDGLRAALAVGRQIIPPDIETRTYRYGDLDVPTLLLWGDNDRVVPLGVGHRLERQLPDARLTVLERCGHMATDERPRESLEVTEGFLDAHPVSGER